MDKYPRTHGGRLATIISLLVFAAIPTLAQNGNTRSNSQQAVLHIRVNIVNTLTLPAVAPGHGSENAVTYNVATAKPEVEVIEEVRPLSSAAIGEAEGGKGAILKTLTVVAH